MQEFPTDDGVRLAYVDVGQGQPLVLVHGWMMSHNVWHKQVEHFAADNRVIALDLRGCGSSDPRPGTYSMQRYAADLDQLLARLDVRDATIVGWSMGGGITMEYLERHGLARVRAVGLVDFPPRLEEDPSVADKVCANLRTKRDAFLDSFVKRMVHDPDKQDVVGHLRAEASRCAPETACDMYRAMRPTGPAQGAPHPSIPAFLAFPEHGWFPKALDDWRQRFPNNTAPAFAASKHCPFLEESKRFNAQLSDFLASP